MKRKETTNIKRVYIVMRKQHTRSISAVNHNAPNVTYLWLVTVPCLCWNKFITYGNLQFNDDKDSTSL